MVNKREEFEVCAFLWTQWRKNPLYDYLPKQGEPPLVVSFNQEDIQTPRLRIYNRLEDNYHLSNKKALFFNMSQYYKLKGIDPFTVLPLTFHIETGLGDPEFEKFVRYFNDIEIQKKKKKQELEAAIKNKTKETKNNDDYYYSEDDEEDEEQTYGIFVPKNIWIMKPGENSNRGNGIVVYNNLRQIQAEITSAAKQNHTHIIQKYIERPLLIHDRKFDIRVFGLMTSINGVTKGYFYDEGYLRTSSSEFSLYDLSDLFVHLTNDAV